MVKLLDLLAGLDPAFGSLLEELADVLVGEEGRLVGEYSVTFEVGCMSH